MGKPYSDRENGVMGSWVFGVLIGLVFAIWSDSFMVGWITALCIAVPFSLGYLFQKELPGDVSARRGYDRVQALIPVLERNIGAARAPRRSRNNDLLWEKEISEGAYAALVQRLKASGYSATQKSQIQGEGKYQHRHFFADLTLDTYQTIGELSDAGWQGFLNRHWPQQFQRAPDPIEPGGSFKLFDDEEEDQ